MSSAFLDNFDSKQGMKMSLYVSVANDAIHDDVTLENKDIERL
jgi:hypothetical protein